MTEKRIFEPQSEMRIGAGLGFTFGVAAILFAVYFDNGATTTHQAQIHASAQCIACHKTNVKREHAPPFPRRIY